MDSNQGLLDAYEARRLADWKLNKEAQQRNENAAREAHRVRRAAGALLLPEPACTWEEMGISSRRHLIADADNVANNPSITLTELTKMYQARLMAWGDTDNPDLEPPSETCQLIEESVLDSLKSTLNNSNAAPITASHEPKANP